jgi:phosphohistidine phosphatase
MNLYFLRHGIAVERGDPRYPNDSLRPLTAEGSRKMRRIATGMRALGLKLDVVLASPYIRARQTAEIVAGAFHAKRKLHVADGLAPEGSAHQLIRLLKDKYAAAEHILLVGHEPDLSEMIGLLLAGRTGVPLALKKGGLCLLTVESLACRRCARLEWLLTPRQLESIAD